jgi:hypothetical protein
MPPVRITLALVSPLAETLMTPGCRGEKIDDRRGFLEEASKSMSPMISLPAPQAARGAATHHVRMLRKLSRIGSATRTRRKQMARGVLRGEIGCPPKSWPGFFRRSRPTPPPCRPCRRLPVLDGFDAELVVERLDFLGADPWGFAAFPKARRNGSLEFLVISQFAGRGQFGDFFCSASPMPLISPSDLRR